MRPIVKSAKNVGELSNQFINVDQITWKQVDEFMPDAYMIKEAKYHLSVAIEWLEELETDDPDYSVWLKDSRQLARFIRNWQYKCQPHKNDGIQWEELELLIKGAN